MLQQSLEVTAETDMLSSSKVQTVVDLETDERRPCVLVALPEDLVRSKLARTLRVSGRVRVLEADPRRTDWLDVIRREALDIAVIHAGYLTLDYAALAHDPEFGFPELVFVVDERCPAQRLALISRGYRHVIGAETLSDWLQHELASLGALAKARRIVLSACSVRTHMIQFCLDTPCSGSMNLHAAETHFRETFLRALLVEHGSRRRASEAAGVPYRSFCEMLRKLGI